MLNTCFNVRVWHLCVPSGFVFADLKPENVVLMENGHAKIADFGAARPLTAKAKDAVCNSLQALDDLPSGDATWRTESGANASSPLSAPSDATPTSSATPSAEGGGDLVSRANNDTRAEGTAAYLAPELVRDGTMPDTASDCWAVGCLLYQCLAGKPPFWAETAVDTMAAIVRFSRPDVSDADTLYPPGIFSVAAQGLVVQLLAPRVHQRATLGATATHAFFAGVDVFTLYTMRAPELAVGVAAPAPDAKWARRQNSMYDTEHVCVGNACVHHSVRHVNWHIQQRLF